MLRLWLILLICLPGLGWGRPMRNAAALEIEGDPKVSYTFGEQLTIEAVFHSRAPLEKVEIALFSEGMENQQPDSTGELTLSSADGGLTTRGVYTQNLKEKPLRAFARLSYSFRASLKGAAEPEQSANYAFVYEDNTFTWQSESRGALRVHWYSGDDKLKEMTLEIAQKALDNAGEWFSAPLPSQVDIYLYANALDLQSTLILSNLRWAAGHADPELGLIVVALPAGPDQRLLAEQRIPHEMTHILLYGLLQERYASGLPAWLNEGLASLAELQPNPDYDTILKYASQRQSFLSFERLCQAFPTDASNAFLAYAQSEWFTRYLYQKQGREKMQALLEAYASGMDCLSGPQSALGISLADLQDEWLSDQFGVNRVNKGISALLPWVFLFGLALLTPLGFLALRPRRAGKGKKQ